MHQKTRQRTVFFCLIVLLCFCGLAVRKWNSVSPNFFNSYFPDAAWTMAVYCGIGFLFCKGARFNLMFSLVISNLVECSQLLHTPLLTVLRGTKLGGLVLGYGFLWSDLVCYTAGALVCAAVQYILRKKRSNP